MQQDANNVNIRVACIQMRRALIQLLKALDAFLSYTDPDRPYANE